MTQKTDTPESLAAMRGLRIMSLGNGLWDAWKPEWCQAKTLYSDSHAIEWLSQETIDDPSTSSGIQHPQGC